MSTSPAPLPTRPSGGRRQYRGIVLAVGCFLAIDLAVLGLSFYTASRIAADAQALNLAGRQRMLSQRIAKALVILDADTGAGKPDPETRAEIARGAAQFGQTLAGFAHGGTVSAGDGTPAVLAALPSTRGQTILARTEATWQPLAAALAPVGAPGDLTAQEIRNAVAAARASNLDLLELMNDLTGELERLADARADRLRAVQAAGLLLALANFGVIVYLFLGGLAASDRAAALARRETLQILGSVREGLFLIDRERRIGTQATASLPGILGRPAVPGSRFAELLAGLAAPAVCAAAEDYIELLFERRVKPALMGRLNPLAEVRVEGEGERYLRFDFTVVDAANGPPGAPEGEAGGVSHLLVTVDDITAQVLLTRDLASAQSRARSEIEMLLAVLNSSPGALDAFSAEAERALRSANRRLRHPGSAPAELAQTVDAVFRLIHAVKGDAAALGLALFELQAHEFEVLLAELRARPVLQPEDLLGLPLRLEEFYERLSLVRAFADQITRAAARVSALGADEAQDAAGSAQFGDSLTQLAQRIAREQHKQVEVDARLEAIGALEPAVAKHVKDIVLQLTRNAVAHGIEAPEERARLAKPDAGRLEVRLSQVDNEFELLLRDDGRGLDPQAIRAQLCAGGRYSPAQLADLDDRQIMMKIFEPGFSTAAAAGRDAGHGVGLDLVNDKIRRLGGHLRLASQPGRFTEFAVRFAA